MLPLLLLIQDAGHAAEGALPPPFSPTPGLFLWTIVVFIALLILLSKLAFPQIVKATVEREQQIASQLAEAARMRDEAKATLEEQRQLLAGARGEAQAILADARQGAERDRMAALERTRAEQDEILARAKQELASERDRLAAELKRETVDLAIAAAGKVVGQKLDAATDRQLVEQYLAELGKRA